MGSANGYVAKTLRGPLWTGGASLLFCLGRHSKEAGDEGDLLHDVSFAHPSDLSLANHVHSLVALQCSPGRFHRKEAHPRVMATSYIYS